MKLEPQPMPRDKYLGFLAALSFQANQTFAGEMCILELITFLAFAGKAADAKA